MSEMALKVGGVEFTRFNRFSLTLNYSGIASTFSFDGFFDINNPNHKRLFKPLSYNICTVEMDGKRVLTGKILNTNTSIAGQSSLTGIAGYSLPGVLEDCEIPHDIYPLQSDGMTFKEIVEKVIKPFDIQLVVDKDVQDDTNTLYGETENTEGNTDLTGGDENKQFLQSNAKENQSCKDYICSMAKQLNILVTHNAYGNIVFTRLKEKRSIATYTENKPSTKISLSVNGQPLHSEIYLQGQSQLETDVETEDSVTNPLVNSYRPSVKTQSVGDNSNIPNTAKMARGIELKNIVLTIETNLWYWYDGNKKHIILPNQFITVNSPSNYLSVNSKWFVDSVTYKGDEKSTVAIITCVLPETFTGETPKYIFQ